jgi:hypothetical protein
MMLGLFAVALSAGRCGPVTYEDPLGRMLDRDRAASVRLAAAEQAAGQLRDDPQYLDTLRKLLWQWGHPTELRCHAFDQLVAQDEQATIDLLNQHLDDLSDWPTFDYIAEYAAGHRWIALTPGLIRRYALPSATYPDDERAERALLEQLHGKPIDQILEDCFNAGGDDAPNPGTQAAAWQLYCRLVGHDAARSRLATVEPRSPLVRDLRQGLQRLGVMPVNRHTIVWLRVITTLNPSFCREAAQAVAQLDASQHAGLELRHLPLLVQLNRADDARLHCARAKLIRSVADQLTGRMVHIRETGIFSSTAPHPQQFDNWSADMSWADLLLLDVLLDALNDQQIVGAWFSEAERDHADHTSEYGGLLTWDDRGRVIARPYAPQMSRHDLAYYAPPQLILDAYTALAHYHFHVQQPDNREYACPGPGDLKRVAQAQRLNGLVLTSVDDGVLNVDFYCQPQIVVDLGELRPPAALHASGSTRSRPR